MVQRRHVAFWLNSRPSARMAVEDLRALQPGKVGRWRRSVLAALEDLEKPAKALRGLGVVVIAAVGVVLYVHRNDASLFLRIFMKGP